MVLRGLFISLLLPLCCAAVQVYTPQAADPIAEPWRWRHISALDGAGVLCMDESSDGAFWFGAAGSLIRYDGRQIQRIPFDDQLLEEPLLARPYAVFAASADDVLVVINNSLFRWSGGEWAVIIEKLESSSLDARIFEAGPGAVWLQMRHSLWRINEELSDAEAVFRVSDECRISACAGQGDEIWVVQSFEDRKDKLFRIPLEGAQLMPEAEWDEFPGADYSGLRHVSLYAAPDNRVWFADNTAAHAVHCFDVSGRMWTEAALSAEKKSFHSLTGGPDGTLMAGGKGELAVWGASASTFYTSAQLDLPRVPLLLFTASSGKMWVIAEFDQVFLFDPDNRQWQTFPGLHFQCESDDGNLQWFLSRDKRIISHDIRTGAWLRHDVADGGIRWPLILKASSSGRVWAAGSNGSGEGGRAAFAVYDGKRWERHSLPDFCDKIFPGAILEALDGSMLFGGRVPMDSDFEGGLLQYQDAGAGKVELLKHHQRPRIPRRISFMAQTKPDELWLGDADLHCFDLLRHTVTEIQSLPQREILDMTAGSDGSLWVAKGGGGLFRKKDGGWRRYSTADGLAGSVVTDLLVLHDGSLLAATQKEISRFDGQTWTRRAYSDHISISQAGSTMKQAGNGSVWFNLNGQDASDAGAAADFLTIRYTAETCPPETAVTFYQDKVSQPGNTQISWAGRDCRQHTPDDRLEYSWRMDDEEWSPYTLETGRMFPSLPHGRHVFEVRARDMDVNVDPTPARIEFSVAAPLRLQPWFIAAVVLFIGGGSAFVGMMLYFHDKRLKDRSRHLEEIDQMKTSFFINISHELNTPLTLIREPLKRLLKTSTSDADKGRLNMAIWNADRVAALVSQLLDFRRLESGKLQLRMEEGDIVTVVRSSLASMKPLAEMHQVSLTLEGISECRGRHDPDKLGKILHNLISNAVKYTPPHGKIRLILKETADPGGRRMLSLVLEDSGYGIAPEHLEHIFERFYRVPEKSIVDGSGIGLNLAQEMVTLWGGSIRAESPVHDDDNYPGTRFTVRLPIGGNSGGTNE